MTPRPAISAAGFACALAAALLAGCATLRQPLGSATWDGVCYQGLHADVDYLSGADAYDCGLLHLDARDGAESQITACARDAVASGRAYRFGYQSFGIDSMYCDVAVRAPDGQIWSLYSDNEALLGGGITLSVQRCKEIAFRRGTIGKGSFFEHDRCERAPEMFDTLAAQRAAH